MSVGDPRLLVVAFVVAVLLIALTATSQLVERLRDRRRRRDEVKR